MSSFTPLGGEAGRDMSGRFVTVLPSPGLGDLKNKSRSICVLLAISCRTDFTDTRPSSSVRRVVLTFGLCGASIYIWEWEDSST